MPTDPDSEARELLDSLGHWSGPHSLHDDPVHGAEAADVERISKALRKAEARGLRRAADIAEAAGYRFSPNLLRDHADSVERFARETEQADELERGRT